MLLSFPFLRSPPPPLPPRTRRKGRQQDDDWEAPFKSRAAAARASNMCLEEKPDAGPSKGAQFTPTAQPAQSYTPMDVRSRTAMFNQGGVSVVIAVVIVVVIVVEAVGLAVVAVVVVLMVPSSSSLLSFFFMNYLGILGTYIFIFFSK